MPKPRPSQPKRRRKGFEAAGSILATRIREAGETRGFAVSRLLTHWPEIVGAETAARTRPVRITHARQGFGATLVLLTTGPQAPLVEMELPRIRECVNATYGYNAIARISITQTAPTGFAEGQAQFVHRKPAKPPAPTARQISEATAMLPEFEDPTLRAAMQRLALNHLSRRHMPRRDQSQGTTPA